jgi:membrane protease YdiL (CAAX protease family)
VTDHSSLLQAVARGIAHPLRSLSAALAPLDERPPQPGPWPPADLRLSREVLLLSAVLIALGFTVLDRPFFDETCYPWLHRHGRALQPVLERYRDLLSCLYWAVAKLLGFAWVPALHLRLRGTHLHQVGLSLSSRRAVGEAPVSTQSGLKLYLFLFAAFLPVLVFISHTPAFAETYPFYRLASRSWLDLLVYEAAYLATFFAIEFFFRGYLLFPLQRSIGSLSLFVVAVPYCLLHINKPLAEQLGAIPAALLLGLLALRAGSIWYGVLLHTSVALSMDLLSLFHRHGFPRSLFP